uniref:ER membrane protein complex subunit 6 n=1 Tax=Phallusia mammillata TaxID=59560 RepID=A0A6F9DCK5_9ASCI|nr:ER membrane protein complex subunit 6-like [Phallusia mammillata]
MGKEMERPLIQNVQYVNPISVRQNIATAEYCRTSVSALSGVTAGILGLTGLYGFAFYLICALSLFLGLVLKAGGRKSSSKQYFMARRQLLLNGQMGALFTYILFWTFLYGMVHVY